MDYDLVIIGSGPAGYVAAIRAAQVGLKTAVIEKDTIGGMCINWGCIPTKALLESAKLFQRIHDASQFGIDGIEIPKLQFNWKAAKRRADGLVQRISQGVTDLLQQGAVDIIRGTASIVSPTTIKVDKRLIEAAHIIIATGSVPEKAAYPVPDHFVVEIREFMALEDIPAQLVVIGRGATAMELAQLIKMSGRIVTLVVNGQTLLPGLDPSLETFAREQLVKDGVNVIMNATITGHYDDGILVGERKIACQKVLNSAFRRAVLPDMKIELATHKGFLQVNEQWRTSQPTIYAVGDVNGHSFTAHVASAQGLAAVNAIKGIPPVGHPAHYPLNVYSMPEIAQVGFTEPQLQEMGTSYKVSEFPLTANAKALIEGYRAGFLRLLSEKQYGEVLGVQIVAPNATDLISEAATLMAFEGTIYDLVKVVHAHPTVSEVYMEAGFAALDQALRR
ncbi:MAG: dihydrolipoyl dehydrogenase [Acidobacteria bacterium]|nr:dihydrolipoyl dehydrogenase [Acidobacteriota bacterium]